MSAQLNLNASQFVISETEQTAQLNHWPLPGWQTVTTPGVARYLRLQQRAEHWENRHFDLALHLRQLGAEQDKGIDHRARMARVERITQRAQQHASAALEALFAEGERLRGAAEEV